jgi:TnpA family transposase
VLERLVASARDRTGLETYRRLEPLLVPELRNVLDGLLVADGTRKGTQLSWLRQGADENSAKAILAELSKLERLREWGADGWDMAGLSHNRLKSLAQLGARSTNQALQRAPEERRYPILLAFLRQTHEDISDEVIEMFDLILADFYRRAGNDLESLRKGAARATNELVRHFNTIGRILLDPDIPDDRLRDAIRCYLPDERLREKLEVSDALVRPLDDSYFDLLAQRYNYIRSFSPRLLSSFKFRSNLDYDPLLAAVDLLRQLDEGRKRKVPEDAPMGFVPPKWLPYVVGEDGKIDRHYYELCVLWELRGALRSGDVWVEGSRRYADPESYLIPRERWTELRPEACYLLGAPVDGRERLGQLREELSTRLSSIGDVLTGSAGVRIEDGDLIVPPIRSDELPESALELQRLVTERLPRIDLTDLLIEVDGWTGFSTHFTHAGGSEPRSPEMLAHLYASILTQACNFTVTEMSAISDISYRRLAWCTTWYLRDETLRPAIASLVNYQHNHALGKLWGGGTLSSSDGQRFPVAVRSRKATPLPRYFGYGRGLTFYTWTSDQWSQYGTKVIPATVRDATYVLDEILDNETELPIQEHATDTAGFTEIMFALFDALGLQFAPRIRDLGDQRLYRLDREADYGAAEPLLKGTINPDLFLRRWDDILRLAASLKMGYVTASLIIGKLQGYPRQNALTKALQEYGRLVKTVFILRCLGSPEYRRRINGQLNKGESLHALRRFLFFANEGEIRRGQEEGQANQASCLNLVTNAVIVWNTVYIQAVLDQLRAEGCGIEDADVLHLSPARYEHINPYGRYHFDVDRKRGRSDLRRLRNPGEADP